MIIISTTVGKNPLAIIVNRRVRNAVLGCNNKNERQTIPITVIQDYASTSNTEEAEAEWFCEDLQDLLGLTPKKRCPFHSRGLECKSRKSGNTWSNRTELNRTEQANLALEYRMKQGKG